MEQHSGNTAVNVGRAIEEAKIAAASGGIVAIIVDVGGVVIANGHLGKCALHTAPYEIRCRSGPL